MRKNDMYQNQHQRDKTKNKYINIEIKQYYLYKIQIIKRIFTQFEICHYQDVNLSMYNHKMMNMYLIQNLMESV